jgi:hypothetical protein
MDNERVKLNVNANANVRHVRSIYEAYTATIRSRLLNDMISIKATAKAEAKANA